MSGILYIVDTTNNRVRMLRSGAPNALAADGVVNSGSYRLGPLSPGEIVTIFGLGIGPNIEDSYREGMDLPTMLQGTLVQFDGIPAPLVYVSRNQISAVVPYAVAGRSSAELSIAGHTAR